MLLEKGITNQKRVLSLNTGSDINVIERISFGGITMEGLPAIGSSRYLNNREMKIIRKYIKESRTTTKKVKNPKFSRENLVNRSTRLISQSTD